MGIQGLTTFIKQNSRRYFENYKLKDGLVIIDGYSLINHLYRKYENQTRAFGGDYDIIATIYINFINLLLRCNVTAIFIFDGGYDQCKLKNIKSNISKNIKLYGRFDKIKYCKSYFSNAIIFDILNDMDIPFIISHSKANVEIVTISKILNCPVMSQDSYFYINSVPFIHLDMINFDLTSKDNVINCKIYKVKNLLYAFGRLHIDYLPLVAVFLGNYYISSNTFDSLLNIPSSYDFGLKFQRIVDWLRKQNTVYNAMNYMINNLSQSRDYIKKQIITIIHEYNSINSKYISFILHHKKMCKYQDYLRNYLKVNENNILPSWLEENYQRGILSAEVITMITKREMIYCAQIEDYEKQPYYEISFKILERIFGLLSEKTDLILSFGRKNGDKTGQYEIKPYVYDPYIPLDDLSRLDIEYRKNIILDLIDVKSFKDIPKEWELFIIALIYWANYTNNRLSKNMIALIICAMIFNIIKNTEIYSQAKSSEDPTDKSGIEENIMKVKKEESIKAMNVLSNYFQVNEYSDKNLYYKIIHPFTQFQCCIYYFMILNSLLSFPFNQCRIENFYKGTFLYNLYVKMENYDDPELFVSQQLFNKLDSLNAAYQSLIDHLNVLI